MKALCCLMLKKQPASFPFLYRFIFSKETINLPSNPWRLDWATILRWIKAQVDTSSFHPTRIGLKRRRRAFYGTQVESFSKILSTSPAQVHLQRSVCQDFGLGMLCYSKRNTSGKYALDLNDETADQSEMSLYVTEGKTLGIKLIAPIFFRERREQIFQNSQVTLRVNSKPHHAPVTSIYALCVQANGFYSRSGIIPCIIWSKQECKRRWVIQTRVFPPCALPWIYLESRKQVEWASWLVV